MWFSVELYLKKQAQSPDCSHGLFTVRPCRGSLNNVPPCVVSSWLSALENTRWLQHLSVMLKAATLVCSAVEREGRPVLVHCSDGWDRTPQIVALAKVLLDPYYRTLEVGIC